jgi:hypothetical protein
MNKKLLIPLIVVLGVGIIAAAGFVVNSFVINVNIGEPFDSIQYAVLGSGSSYDPVTHGLCSAVTVWTTYSNNEEIEMGYLDAGESRKICVKITNNADADLIYTITPTVFSGGQACLDAFSGISPLTGTATKATDTITEELVSIAQNASTVDNCKIRIDVARG